MLHGKDGAVSRAPAHGLLTQAPCPEEDSGQDPSRGGTTWEPLRDPVPAPPNRPRKPGAPGPPVTDRAGAPFLLPTDAARSHGQAGAGEGLLRRESG